MTSDTWRPATPAFTSTESLEGEAWWALDRHLERDSALGTTGMSILRQVLPDGAEAETRVFLNGPSPLHAVVLSPVEDEEGGIVVMLTNFIFESGSYVFAVNGDTYTATWHLGEPIDGWGTPSVDWSDDGSVDSDDSIIPLGDIGIGLPIIPLDGDVSPGGYAPDISRALVSDSHKVYQLLFPASLLPGKMRLWVQAIYGVSGRTDYRVINSGGWPELRVSNYPIGYTGLSSDWLVTTDDWAYYIASVRVTDLNDVGEVCTVSFRRLLPVAGREVHAAYFRERLQSLWPAGQADRLTRELVIIEALLLAQMKPSVHVTQSVDVTLPSRAVDFGGPIAYGWQARWDGSEASIVLTTTDDGSYGVCGQTLRMAVSHTTDNDTHGFTVTASLPASVTGTIYNDRYVWLPNPSAFIESWLADQWYLCSTPGAAGLIPNPPETYSNLPVFGFYDSNDAWRPVTFSFHAKSSDDLGLYNGGLTMSVCGFGSDSEIAVVGPSGWLESVVSVGTRSLSVIANIGSATYREGTASVTPGESIEGDIDSWVDHGYAETCEEGLCGSIEGEPCSSGTASRAFDYQMGLGNAIVTDLQTAVFQGSVSIIIPWGDCSSVLIGVKKYSDATYSSQYTESNVPLAYPAEYTQVRTIVFNGTEYVPDQTVWSGSNVRRHTTSFSGTWGSDGSTINGYPRATKQVDIWFADLTGNQELYSERTGHGPGDGLDLVSSRSDLVLPGAGVNTGYDDAWDGFFTAPIGICISGARELSYLPKVAVSASELSRLAYGTPDAVANVAQGGYPEESNGFIGAA